MQLVPEFLEDSASRTPDKTALICAGQSLTYGELDVLANRLANALRDRGVRCGDRVLLFLPNSVELVVGIFAILKADAVFVPLNATTKPDKLIYLARNSQATALIAPARQREPVETILRAAPSLRFAVLTNAQETVDDRLLSYDDLLTHSAGKQPVRHSIDRDLACLIYTSGSTGEPKGVMSDHSNVVFAASSIISYLENRPDDVVINVLPLSFDYGLYQLLMTFKFGGTLVLEKGFAYPAHVLGRMEELGVTGFPGVPTLFAMLLQLDLSGFDLCTLRYMTNTGAALPTEHVRRLRQVLPKAKLFSMYGLTETKRALYLPPEQLEVRPSSVGKAIPGTEVWLEDGEGNRLGPTEVGELIIRGGHVMRGYWGDPEATALRFRSGPLPGERICASGDLFWMDDEGYFYFVGRRDDMIKSRGEKVAPREIENLLYRLPGVLEAAVVGVPDRILGEAIKAVVVVEPGQLTEADVLRYCRSHLENFMVPQVVELRDSLPRTANDKIDRDKLT